MIWEKQRTPLPKIRFSRSCIFLALLWKLFTPDSIQAQTYADKICRQSQAEVAPFLNLAYAERDVYDTFTDQQYMEAFWKVSPDVAFIEGKIIWHFKTVLNTDSLVLDFGKGLHIDSIIYHSVPINYRIDPLKNLLIINTPSGIPAHTLDAVEINYHGQPESTGFGSFVSQQHQTGPVLWTLSQPYGAKDWWPVKQSLNDKFDSIKIHLIYPETYVGVSNGIKTGETISSGYKQSTFTHRYPIAYYLIAFAVSNYSIIQDTLVTNSSMLPINSYAYPQHEVDLKNAVLKNKNHFIQLESMFGPYPFRNEQYGHAEVGFSGGMEHQTISFEGYFGEDLLTHELAHQWFGNAITCASWADIWLNEGFATFLTGLIIEKNYPTETFMAWKKDLINYICSETDGSVYVKDTTSYQRIFDGRLSYSKGAMVLHMLRHELGDSVFFTSISNYLNDPLLKYKQANTSDLKKHLEQVSGENLGYFFNQWIYNEGFPTYSLQYSYDSSTETTGVTIKQKSSLNNKDFFRQKIELLFKGDQQDSLVSIWINTAEDQFSLSLGFRPTDLIIDPYSNTITSKNAINQPEKRFNDEFIHFYPNPFTNLLMLDYYNTRDALSLIELTDLSGKLIKILDLSKTASIIGYTLDFSALPEGMYFAKVTTKNASATFKLIKVQ